MNMREAFCEAYQTNWDDPTREEERLIWIRSWENAMASVGLQPEVLAFAQLMQKKLNANKDKGHWHGLSFWKLWQKFEGEKEEFWTALTCEPAINIHLEAADVANYAMMLADNEMSLVVHPDCPDCGDGFPYVCEHMKGKV